MSNKGYSFLKAIFLIYYFHHNDAMNIQYAADGTLSKASVMQAVFEKEFFPYADLIKHRNIDDDALVSIKTAEQLTDTQVIEQLKRHDINKKQLHIISNFFSLLDDSKDLHQILQSYTSLSVASKDLNTRMHALQLPLGYMLYLHYQLVHYLTERPATHYVPFSVERSNYYQSKEFKNTSLLPRNSLLRSEKDKLDYILTNIVKNFTFISSFFQERDANLLKMHIYYIMLALKYNFKKYDFINVIVSEDQFSLEKALKAFSSVEQKCDALFYKRVQTNLTTILIKLMRFFAKQNGFCDIKVPASFLTDPQLYEKIRKSGPFNIQLIDESCIYKNPLFQNNDRANFSVDEASADSTEKHCMYYNKLYLQQIKAFKKMFFLKSNSGQISGNEVTESVLLTKDSRFFLLNPLSKLFFDGHFLTFDTNYGTREYKITHILYDKVKHDITKGGQLNTEELLKITKKKYYDNNETHFSYLLKPEIGFQIIKDNYIKVRVSWS